MKKLQWKNDNMTMKKRKKKVSPSLAQPHPGQQWERDEKIDWKLESLQSLEALESSLESLESP